MKREYLHSFVSLETASEYNRKVVLNLRVDQDDLKSTVVLKIHPDVYRRWGDELLKPWSLKNWERWEAEKPVWFTVKWVDCVPNEYIPYDWRVKYKKTKGRVEGRRRSSIAQVKMLLGEEEER
ncbi:hypothetical protein TrLO_g8533 [Triparma laevis f. longispina]|uniref:Uncharacterized protein n=1 Tax=Triparma laevis f. longispina TaxID=1714387 RepID=A0A9W7C5F2_9STRA|nr:hypothetical protein TrLO_g8533 [Triparma laevis f. longispina]